MERVFRTNRRERLSLWAAVTLAVVLTSSEGAGLRVYAQEGSKLSTKVAPSVPKSTPVTPKSPKLTECPKGWTASDTAQSSDLTTCNPPAFGQLDTPPWPKPPLIPLELSEVEPPRNVPASDYRSPYCRLWDDGCAACRLEEKDSLKCVTLSPENTNGTYPKVCVRKPIACHEIFEEELARRCLHFIGIDRWTRFLELDDGKELGAEIIEQRWRRTRPFRNFSLPTDHNIGFHYISDWFFSRRLANGTNRQGFEMAF
jgi:hypothetical protein